jgi:hypothetical protein
MLAAQAEHTIVIEPATRPARSPITVASVAVGGKASIPVVGAFRALVFLPMAINARGRRPREPPADVAIGAFRPLVHSF